MKTGFTADTYVRYASSGVCRIEEIKTMAMPGTHQKREYYVLRPTDNEASVIYVPADNEAMTASMIPVLTRQEIDDIILSACADSMAWVDDRKERAESHRDILKRCDRRELLQLVSCIYLRKKELAGSGRKLASSDEATLRQAERLVNNELTFVLGINESEVGGYIRGLLDSAE